MILKHSVYDTDTHFSIDPATRALNNEALQKTSLIQNDHNCERFTFEMPRTIEGHDMSKCDIVQVHYINIDAQTKAQSKGVYEVTDMQISPDGDDVVICSWLIPCTATQYVGSLSFLLRFCCVAEDGKTLHYVWHTAIYSGISVSNGIYNGDIVSEEFPEILREWQKELQNNMIASVEQTQSTAADGGLNVWTMKMGDGRTFDFRVYNGRAGDVTIIQQPPQFVDSIEECTDKTKLYVLPDGYIYHYRNTTIVHPAEQETTDVKIIDRRHLFAADFQVKRGTVDNYCVTDWIDLTNVPRPCHINLKGVRWGARSATNHTGTYWAAFTSAGNYSTSNLVNGNAVTQLAPEDTADYKIVNNNDTYTDVTVTIKSDKVKMVAFTGQYASSGNLDEDGIGGAGNYSTAEAVLYYNVTEETVETVEGWYSTGHTWGGEGGAGVGILRITESTVDGGSNVVTFTDGNTLTIKNGKKGSAGAQGEKGDTGAAGYTPVKGVDYFTEADKTEIARQAAEMKVSTPDYWEPAIVETINEVTELQNKGGVNTFTFGFITDTHVDATTPATFAHILERVLDTCDIPVLLHGGDIVSGAGIIPKDGLIDQIARHKEIFTRIEDRTLLTFGNHDAAYGVADYYDHNLTDGEIYNYIFRKNQTKNNIVCGSTGRYFYKDVPAQKTRYIVLDCLAFNTEVDADQFVIANNKMNYANFGCEQLKWLAENALNVPKNYQIVLCSHFPPYREADRNAVGWPGEDSVLDSEIALGIVNSYRNKTAYSHNETISDGTLQEAYDIDIDFTNYNGEIVCWVAGHTHKDYIFDCDGLKVVSTCNNSLHVSTNPTGYAPEKVSGTDSEYAMDFFCVDTVNKSCQVIRLGATLSSNIRAFDYGAGYTNVIPTSLDPLSVGEVYNGVGYKNDTRFDSEEAYRYEGVLAGHVLTGLIYYPISNNSTVLPTIYVKGNANLISGDSGSRIGFFPTNNGVGLVAVSNIRGDKTDQQALFEYISVTNLGEDYHAINFVKDGDTYKIVQYLTQFTTDGFVNQGYIRINMSGTGEGLIISIGNPIE